MDLDTAFKKIKECCGVNVYEFEPECRYYYLLTRRLQDGEFEEIELWSESRYDANIRGKQLSPHDDDTDFNVERLA